MESDSQGNFGPAWRIQARLRSSGGFESLTPAEQQNVIDLFDLGGGIRDDVNTTEEADAAPATRSDIRPIPGGTSAIAKMVAKGLGGVVKRSSEVTIAEPPAKSSRWTPKGKGKGGKRGAEIPPPLPAGPPPRSIAPSSRTGRGAAPAPSQAPTSWRDAPRERVRGTPYKQECWFWRQGYCEQGDDCPFRHIWDSWGRDRGRW